MTTDFLLKKAIAATIKAEEAEEQSKRYADAAIAAEAERREIMDELAAERKLSAIKKGVILFKYDGTIYECYWEPHAPRSSWKIREVKVMY